MSSPTVPTVEPAGPARAAGAMLSLSGVHAGYGEVAVLHGLDLHVHRAECVVLLGPNGVGKTTTLRTISGVLRPRLGTVSLDGTRIDRRPAHTIARMGVAHVPEGRGIFPGLSVRENLTLGTFSGRGRGSGAGYDRVVELFPVLAEKLHQRAGALSGGQQQMLAIGRGLMAAPTVLLLDEPSLGLSPVVVEQVLAALRAIKEQGTTILLVEQNVRHALRLADYAYVINRGIVVAEGSGDEVAQNIDRAYLS